MNISVARRLARHNMGSRFLNPIVAGTGAAATIDVGIVSALAPGSGASVVNVGTDTNAIFNFGIAVGAAHVVHVGSTHVIEFVCERGKTGRSCIDSSRRRFGQ